MRGGFRDQGGLFSYIDLEKCIPVNYPLCQVLSTPLVRVLNGIRSERQLMERLDYNLLLFRWFVGLSADDQVWDATYFTKNRSVFSRAKCSTSSCQAPGSPKVKP